MLTTYGKKASKKYTVTKIEGPRKEQTKEALAGLRPVFRGSWKVVNGR